MKMGWPAGTQPKHAGTVRQATAQLKLKLVRNVKGFFSTLKERLKKTWVYCSTMQATW